MCECIRSYVQRIRYLTLLEDLTAMTPKMYASIVRMYIHWSNYCWHAQHTLVVFVSFQRVVAFTQEFIPPLQVKLKQKFPVVITGGSMEGITVMVGGQVEMGDRWQCYILFCVYKHLCYVRTFTHACMHTQTHRHTETHRGMVFNGADNISPHTHVRT